MRESTGKKMVGRAELKIEEAAKAFRFDFREKTVLDIGSSTGGFTEYALRNGAGKVIAVEKGTRQMKVPLRFDERVELYEKTDFFEVMGMDAEGRLIVGKEAKGEKRKLAVEVVLADVSFVSLRKILWHAKKIVSSNADYLVMLKPQFEASEEQLNRGVVKNERMRREIIRGFEDWLRRNGFVVVAKRDNETVGKVAKNRERFYWLKDSLLGRTTSSNSPVLTHRTTKYDSFRANATSSLPAGRRLTKDSKLSFDSSSYSWTNSPRIPSQLALSQGMIFKNVLGEVDSI